MFISFHLLERQNKGKRQIFHLLVHSQMPTPEKTVLSQSHELGTASSPHVGGRVQTLLPPRTHKQETG